MNKHHSIFVLTIIIFVAIIIGILKYYEILDRIDNSQNMEAGVEIEENSIDIINNQQTIKVLQIQIELLEMRIKELSNIENKKDLAKFILSKSFNRGLTIVMSSIFVITLFVNI